MLFYKNRRYQVTEDGDDTVPKKNSIIEITRIHIDEDTQGQIGIEYIMVEGLPPVSMMSKINNILSFSQNSRLSNNLKHLIAEDRERILTELGI